MATADNVLAIVKFFGFAIFLLVLGFMWSRMTTSDMNSSFWGLSSTAESIRDNNQRLVNNLDNIAIMAYIFLHLGIIILAYFLRTHPIVYIGGIIIIICMMVVAPILSNTWNEVLQEPEFTSLQSSYPKLDMIMDNYPLLEMVWMFITLIVFAGLARSENII